jgi:hypothetical protein
VHTTAAQSYQLLLLLLVLHACVVLAALCKPVQHTHICFLLLFVTVHCCDVIDKAGGLGTFPAPTTIAFIFIVIILQSRTAFLDYCLHATINRNGNPIHSQQEALEGNTAAVTLQVMQLYRCSTSWLAR